jgi:peptidoglycan-N-acetylglucosamine deacetylase
MRRCPLDGPFRKDGERRHEFTSFFANFERAKFGACTNPAARVLLRGAALAAVNFWSIAAPVAGVAAGVAAWGAVHPTSELFGSTVHHTRRRREIALTFDDGPNPAITPQLLELLERHSARATFFLIGRFARACPELVREIAARGHAIGNHTETHCNLAVLSSSRTMEEIARCRESIAGALARGTGEARGAARGLAWMRPPFGYRGPQTGNAVRRAGLRGVAMWSLVCYEWRRKSAAELIARLARVEVHSRVRHTRTRGGLGDAGVNRGGDVILLHDGDFRALGADLRHVLAALEHWLPRWRDAGLEFVTMDQIGDEVRSPGQAGNAGHVGNAGQAGNSRPGSQVEAPQ